MSEETKPGIEMAPEMDWEAQIEADRKAAEEKAAAEALKEQEVPVKQEAQPEQVEEKSKRKRKAKAEEKQEAKPAESAPVRSAEANAAVEEFLKEAAGEDEEEESDDIPKIGTKDVISLIATSKDPKEEAAELRALTEASGETTEQRQAAIRTQGTLQNMVYSSLSPDIGSVMWNDTSRREEAGKDLQRVIDKKEEFIADKETATTSGPATTLGGNTLSGEAAVFSMLARVQGLKKVYFFNSGFNASLRPPNQAELSTLIESLDMERREIGRMYGGFSHTADGIAIKERFMELFPSFVVKSNLKQFDRPGVLARCLSFHDYDVALWALCGLEYKDGFDATLSCLNPKCHQQTTVKIDFQRTRFNTLDRLTDAAKAFVLAGKPVSESELVEYRKTCLVNLPKLEREVNATTKVVFDTQVPVMDHYLTTGRSLLSHVFATVHGDHTYRNEDLARYYGLHSIRMILPWISAASTYMGGELDFRTESQEAIGRAIDGLFDIGKLEDFTNLINDTRISHICYPQLKCAHCGRVPGVSVDDYYPVDMEQLFFALSSLRLVQGE